MKELTKTRIRWTGFGAAVGIGLGALLGFRIWGAPGDDDRPPIFVRGGSLLFELGDEESVTLPWLGSSNQWYADPAVGFEVDRFRLYFTGGGEGPEGRPCRYRNVAKFTILFDHDGDNSTTPHPYEVNIERIKRRWIPTVTGEDLAPVTGKNWILRTGTDGVGKIVAVYNDNTNKFRCEGPRELAIEPIRR